MPLSEHEQQVLRQIERELQRERGLARPLRMPMGPEEASRNAKLASAGFVVGLLLLLISFASSWLVGLMGFLVMLACAVSVIQSVRRVVQARFDRAAWAGRSHDARGARGARGAGGHPGGTRRPWPGDVTGTEQQEG